nr:MAG TPA: hypothetical protein [Caudoviricetes sp.]
MFTLPIDLLDFRAYNMVKGESYIKKKKKK